MYFFLVRFFLTATLTMSSSVKARTSHLESNDINDVFNQPPFQEASGGAAAAAASESRLPECAGNTICAYLQANSKGINTQSLCSCKGPNRCPLVWDSEDGHSITQGSDQYKYCKKAPALRTCQRGMTAYTTVSLLSKSTGEMLSLNDVNHCLCPQSSNYDLVDSQFDDVDDDIESMSTTYVCNPLKICAGSDACKVITETSTTFLVNPKCRCGTDTACPSTASAHHYDAAAHHQQRRFTETVRYGNGALHMIYCH